MNQKSCSLWNLFVVEIYCIQNCDHVQYLSVFYQLNVLIGFTEDS